MTFLNYRPCTSWAGNVQNSRIGATSVRIRGNRMFWRPGQEALLMDQIEAWKRARGTGWLHGLQSEQLGEQDWYLLMLRRWGQHIKEPSFGWVQFEEPLNDPPGFTKQQVGAWNSERRDWSQRSLGVLSGSRKLTLYHGDSVLVGQY